MSDENCIFTVRFFYFLLSIGSDDTLLEIEEKCNVCNHLYPNNKFRATINMIKIFKVCVLDVKYSI